MWYTPIYNLYLIDSVHLDHRYKKAQVSSNFDRDRSFREKKEDRYKSKGGSVKFVFDSEIGIAQIIQAAQCQTHNV
jgi:hypothetical protein